MTEDGPAAGGLVPLGCENAHSHNLTTGHRIPADRHPVAVYLASLRPGSRRSTRQALQVVAETLKLELELLPWHQLRYQHTQAVRAAVADRFGAPGLLAWELAQGRDGALRPRELPERIEEELELPEALAGTQLDHALGLLVDRLLARRERDGRTLRAVVLAATLVEGGTWREQVPFREALADPARMRLALTPRLALLPAPAERLRLAAVRFGAVASDQRSLLDEAETARRARLREGVRQARAAAGPDAALRVLAVDPDSRVPERRAVLTPFE